MKVAGISDIAELFCSFTAHFFVENVDKITIVLVHSLSLLLRVAHAETPPTTSLRLITAF